MTDAFVDEDVTDDHAKSVCKIGQGKDCCRYIARKAAGWSCERTTTLAIYMDAAVERGVMKAAGINCGGRRPR